MINLDEEAVKIIGVCCIMQILQDSLVPLTEPEINAAVQNLTPLEVELLVDRWFPILYHDDMTIKSRKEVSEYYKFNDVRTFLERVDSYDYSDFEDNTKIAGNKTSPGAQEDLLKEFSDFITDVNPDDFNKQ